MGTQRYAGLATDLVRPVYEVGQRPELLDPLGGGLLPHPRHRRQVVRRVAAQRREVRVLHGGETVFRLDLRRREPGHVTDPTPGHQHRHLVVDELQRVPVTGDDQHLHAHGRALGGKRRDDVVGLVALGADPGHRERVAHLVDEADLPDEVRGRLGASRLVLGVLGVPEGGRRQIPRHRDVGGALIAQHIDQHRRETVDRVGRLSGRRGEVLDREREERPIGQGVAVEEQQPRLTAAGSGRPGGGSVGWGRCLAAG